MEPDINKIYLHTKNPYEEKYRFLIDKREVKNEMPKNVLFYFNFKLKIEWRFRCMDS